MTEDPKSNGADRTTIILGVALLIALLLIALLVILFVFDGSSGDQPVPEQPIAPTPPPEIEQPIAPTTTAEVEQPIAPSPTATPAG